MWYRVKYNKVIHKKFKVNYKKNTKKINEKKKNNNKKIRKKAANYANMRYSKHIGIRKLKIKRPSLK